MHRLEVLTRLYINPAIPPEITEEARLMLPGKQSRYYQKAILQTARTTKTVSKALEGINMEITHTERKREWEPLYLAHPDIDPNRVLALWNEASGLEGAPQFYRYNALARSPHLQLWMLGELIDRVKKSFADGLLEANFITALAENKAIPYGDIQEFIQIMSEYAQDGRLLGEAEATLLAALARKRNLTEAEFTSIYEVAERFPKKVTPFSIYYRLALNPSLPLAIREKIHARYKQLSYKLSYKVHYAIGLMMGLP